MPSLCLCSLLYRTLCILLIISFETIFSSTNSYQHQILKTDLGQDVTMTCFFDQDKINQVTFMRQKTGDILSVGTELFINEISTKTQHIQLKQISNNRLDLKINSVNENDSGMYTCMLNDEKLASFLLEILVPPRFVSYSPIEGSISYSEGSSMNLSCQAFAIPPANITWIFRDLNKQSKIIHNKENVHIRSVESNDSGSYECIISNGYHASISRSFYVTIQYSPHVILSNHLIESHLHDTVIVHCQVCSIPKLIHLNWFKNNQLTDDLNFIIKTQPIDQHYPCLISTMEIVDISPYQFGIYECRAENNLGRNSSFVNIQLINSNSIRLKPNEINRNGRTALLIENKNLNLTFLFNRSVRNQFSFLILFGWLFLNI